MAAHWILCFTGCFLLCQGPLPGREDVRPEAQPAAGRAFEQLEMEFQAGVDAIEKEMLNEKTPEEVSQTLWASPELSRMSHLGPRYLSLAAEHPKTDVAWKALRWVVYVKGFTRDDKRTAQRQMFRDHMHETEFQRDLPNHLRRWGLDVEMFFRELIATPDAPRHVVGVSLYTLGLHLKDRGGSTHFGEAVELFRRVQSEYADLSHPYGLRWGTLGDAAGAALFEMQRLRVGEPVPDLSGPDADGRRVDLFDLRGKVVLLVFCGDWCGPCRSLYPHEKRWTARYRGRPFAVLGVNSDSPEKLRELLEREQFDFRWIAEGGTAGPIARQWNVDSWPRLFVIDSAGTIRLIKRGASEPEALDEVLDRLVSEAEGSSQHPR